MSLDDEFGVYDIVGDLSSPPNDRNYAPSGQNRNGTPEDGVLDEPIALYGWYDKGLDHRSFYTLPYRQKDKGSTAGKCSGTPRHETQAEQIQMSRQTALRRIAALNSSAGSSTI